MATGKELKALVRNFNTRNPGSAKLIESDGSRFVVEFSDKNSVSAFRSEAEKSLNAKIRANIEKAKEKIKVTFSAKEKSPVEEILGVLKRYEEGTYARAEETED